ncbi:hypothetical protein J6590_010228 [Homalodisca vitripennis]|nr:hypothetical protein J6590_010228 [Homalodisca vitripennis]
MFVLRDPKKIGDEEAQNELHTSFRHQRQSRWRGILNVSSGAQLSALRCVRHDLLSTVEQPSFLQFTFLVQRLESNAVTNLTPGIWFVLYIQKSQIPGVAIEEVELEMNSKVTHQERSQIRIPLAPSLATSLHTTKPSPQNTVSNREMAKCDQSLSKRQKMCQLLTNSCQPLTADPPFLTSRQTCAATISSMFMIKVLLVSLESLVDK